MIPIEEEKELLEYLDGTLSEGKRNLFEIKLSKSEVLRKRLTTLKTIDTLLTKTQRLDSPSKNFSSKVLQNLNHYQPPVINVSKNAVFLLVGVFVAILISSAMLSFDSLDNLNGSFNLQNLYKQKEFIKLPTISVNGKWIINCILITATGVSLILFDRVILKPYFAKKGKAAY